MKWTNDKVKHVLEHKKIKTTEGMHQVLTNLLTRIEALENVPACQHHEWNKRRSSWRFCPDCGNPLGAR